MITRLTWMDGPQGRTVIMERADKGDDATEDIRLAQVYAHNLLKLDWREPVMVETRPQS